jgi:glycerol kinase
VRSSGVVGATDAKLFGAEIPIAGIAGDQQAALFGQGCHAAGQAKNTYGTGCFMLLNVGERPQASANRLLCTVGWLLGDRPGSGGQNPGGPGGGGQDGRRQGGARSYALEGSVFIGGAVVQWLRDGLGLIARSEEVEALALQVPDSGGVSFVPAFTGLGAPHWDADARGLIIGLTRGSTRAHLARAAIESIALQSAEVLDAMQRDAQQPVRELRVDGGAARNDLLMQVQADVMGVPVVRPQVTETTALGAAYLAGLAVGYWQDCDEIGALWRADRRFEPVWPADRRAEKMATWRRAVERARGWAD